MVDIISPMQSAYVPGRLISENICLAQDLVKIMKKKRGRNGHLALKMDMSKAFDRLEWVFLDGVLKQFGFCDKFRHLIQQYISTTTIEIMIDGSPSSSFSPTRGIRQGDPFSPYLFILAMEAFSRQLHHFENTIQLTGMKISRSAPKINHLLFADDCLLFCKANLVQTNNLLQVIENFSACSGQLINFHKSVVFFSKNTSPSSAQIISGNLQVRQLSINVEKYLGLPFFVGRNKRIPFSNLQKKMESRLSKWVSVNVSEAGSFKLPDATINYLNYSQQIFWRNKKTNKGKPAISWKKVSKSKEEGGLGFRDLKLFNRALLAKSAWRLCTDETSMCALSLKAKYFPDGKVFNIKDNPNSTWSWRSISFEIMFIKKHSCWSIGNDHKIKIWSYRWISDLPDPPAPKNGVQDYQNYTYLHELFTDSGGWNYSLIFSLFEAITTRLILNLSIHPQHEDRLVWTLENNGKFTVKSAYRRMFEDHNIVQTVGQRMKKIFKRMWKVPLLPRITYFLWKCLQDILQTRDKLTYAIQDGNYGCPMCTQTLETSSHIILHCHFSRAVWFAVLGLHIQGDANMVDWFINWFDKLSANQIQCKLEIDLFLRKTPRLSAQIPKQCRVNLHWSPPPLDAFKINVDGSFHYDIKNGGIGIIVRDFAGVHKGSRCIYSEAAWIPEHVECKDLWEAV
ncbi:uncharacterized protein LOC113335597 [Papaver somniferum]|uniref:uncharacterized protein LOC113335597 n=1 Tax=Papaver somniferum TaxID=3469 RepID=UPI000E6FBEB8|nr:uncharacterized protein LOC113335597 [Papaver somniferum]